MKSRWEALKADEEHRTTRRIFDSSSNKISATGNRAAETPSARVSSSVTIVLPGRAPLNQKVKIKEKYNTFLDRCSFGEKRLTHLSEGLINCVQELSEIVAQSLHDLPPEHVANHAVHGVFCPFLDLVVDHDNEIEQTNKNREFAVHRQQNVPSKGPSSGADGVRAARSVLQTLTSLLRNKAYASAVVAPLVEYVSSNGQEHLVPNPARASLFSTLERQVSALSSPNETHQSAQVACKPNQPTTNTARRMQLLVDGLETLAVALSVARSTIETRTTRRRSQDSMQDLSPQSVQRWVTTSHLLENTSTRRSFLKFLLSFLEGQPDTAASSLAAVLLFPEPSHRGLGVISRNTELHRDALSVFLSYLHPSSDCRLSSLACQCTIALLKRLPLQLWLKDFDSPASDRLPATPSPVSFQQRIWSAIQTLLAIVACRAEHSLSLSSDDINLAWVQDTCALTTCVLSLPIPYRNQELKPSAVAVVDSMARCILDTEPVDGLKLRAAWTSTWASMLGGLVTPQGVVTQPAVPVSLWLDTAAGRHWVHMVLTRIQQNVKDDEPINKALQALLRAFPLTVVGDPCGWSTFSQILDSKLTTMKQLQVTSAWVEALLRGRSGAQRGEGFPSGIVVSVLPLLQTALREGNTACKISASHSFGYLGPCDWISICQQNSLLEMLSPLLTICIDSQYPVNQRSECFKTLGEIATSLLAAENIELMTSDHLLMEQAQDFCRKVLDVSSVGLRDAHASVRCLSVFAIGNLAQALHSSLLPHWIGYDQQHAAAEHIVTTLRDTDDKVVCNAIRTIGHCVVLLLQSDSSKHMALNLSSLTFNLFNFLSSKIRCSLAVELGSHEQNKFSWKQRAAIKRQGWGSCNCLAILFQRRYGEETGTLCEDLVTVLIDCVVHAHEINEKMSIAAMTALRSIDRLTFMSYSRQNGCTGLALLSCILLCVEKEGSSRGVGVQQKVLEEAEVLLMHLLNSACVTDARYVLCSPQLSTRLLLALGLWMVDKGCLASSFDAFVSAMQTRSFPVDIEVERLFCTRALCIELSSEVIQGDEL